MGDDLQAADERQVLDFERLVAALVLQGDLVAIITGAEQMLHLRHAVDRVPLDFDDDVTLLKARLRRGRVGGHHRDLRLSAVDVPALHPDSENPLIQVFPFLQTGKGGEHVFERNGEADPRIVPLEAGCNVLYSEDMASFVFSPDGRTLVTVIQTRASARVFT